MKLIIGLGNPGDQYKKTRHNLGFMALDHFAARIGAKFNHRKKKTLYGKTHYNGSSIILLKPQTFMNLSGEAVLYMASFLKIPPHEIIVLCDDINLPFGRIRVRKSGSAGGHNGLKSMISCLNSQDFPRVRLGVGEARDNSSELCDHVLGRFSRAEQDALPVFFERTSDLLETILLHSIDRAMNEYNGVDFIKN